VKELYYFELQKFKPKSYLMHTGWVRRGTTLQISEAQNRPICFKWIF